MPGKRRVVRHDAVVSHHTVVSNVHVSHNPVIAAQHGFAAILRRAPADRTVFANRISITYHQASGFIRVLLVLWIVTDRCELINPILTTDGCRAIYNDVATNSSAGANLDISADNRVRTYNDIVRNTGGLGNYGASVNTHESFSSSVLIRS